MNDKNAQRDADGSAPACSADEWRNIAIASLTLADGLVGELRSKCSDPLHETQAAKITELLKHLNSVRPSGR